MICPFAPILFANLRYLLVDVPNSVSQDVFGTTLLVDSQEV